MTSSSERIAIGIDLGTCMSCVAIFQNGRAEVIPNDQGNRITPSMVGFSTTDGERLLGDAAKSGANSNPKNTLFDVKRIIGRNFDDPQLKDDIQRLPYTVKDDGSGRPQIEVEYNGEVKSFYPEAVSAMILTKMKEIAEMFVGKKVTDAVVTVPAYFNNKCRDATKTACEIAGMNCLRVINEPTAASIAYHLDKKATRDQYVLVFDMGGGTHDVSLLEISTDGLIEVKATGGDVHLGGTDLDDRLLRHCMEEFKKKSKIDIKDNVKASRRLLTACERAKKALSSSQTTNVEVDSLADGIDFNLSISRAKFESLCSDIFQRAIDPVSRVLQDAKISKSQVDEIVLVGGSTRIPKVQEMLSQYFNNKELNRTVNPDEAVAVGAAIQAAILIGDKSEATKDLLLLDVTPLSLSIETAGQISTVIVPRGSTIPVKKSETFSTYADNQPGCTIRIFEGERKMTKDNNLLGQFDLSGFPPAPRGVPKIIVDLDVDANGILNVTAREESSGKSEKITITNDKSRLSKDEIERLIREAEKFKDEDERIRSRIESRNGLENFVYQIKSAFSTGELSSKFTEDDKKVLEELCATTTEWLGQETDSRSKEEYDAKQKEVEQIYHPIIQRVYAANGGAPGGAGGAGGMPDMAQMAEMMKGMGAGGAGGMPDMAQMAEMMKGMQQGGGAGAEPEELD
jgi:L1 cell adhesion molecule like protein